MKMTGKRRIWWIELWLMTVSLSIIGVGCVVTTPAESGAAAPAEQAAAVPATPPPGKPGEVVYEKMTMTDDTTIDYAVLLPSTFEAGQTYPVLLALPPGAQTQEMVQVGLDSYWADEAFKRGWVVISPIAPGGKLFFQGSEVYLPEFLDKMAEFYRPEGGKFHIGGISNGGLSAFHFALNHPEYVKSLLVLPGAPPTKPDVDKLAVLKDIPVVMFAGENDPNWVKPMQNTEAALSALGGQVSLTVVPGEGHVIHSCNGTQLFDLLESFR